MDHKTDQRETRDFMSVDSFSQLPFLRPSPPPLKGKAIRVFGKEFGVITNTNTTNNTPEVEVNIADKITCSIPDNNNNNDNNNDNTSHRIAAAATRKFECHYCCRIFPTSQALGGHQNAHKRERQHAKQAHFQPTTNGHDYYSYTSITTLPSTIANYHPWNSSSNSSQYYSGSTRLTNNGVHLYGSSNTYHHHQQQPINGCPLPVWRIPAAPTTNNPPQTNPLFNYSKDGDRFMTTKPLSAMRNTSGLNTQRQLIGYESKPSMQDHRHVSLDLHL